MIFGSYSNSLSGNRLILPWVLSKQCSCKHADSHLVDQSAPSGKCRCGELTDLNNYRTSSEPWSKYILYPQKSVDMRKNKRDISSYPAMMDYIERMIEREEEERKKLEDSEDDES